MKEITAKNKIIEAGKRLVSSGLIARSWGNVSSRLDEGYFVITPSGRLYDSLNIEDIVKVSLLDLSWEGKLKPSSEKGLHAAIYRGREEAGFIIHTHQFFASALSVVGQEMGSISMQGPESLGPVLITQAKYALPGTKALAKNVIANLAPGGYGLILMAKHGAICFAHNDKEAFLLANELEKFSENFIIKKAISLGCKNCSTFLDAYDFAFRKHGPKIETSEQYSENSKNFLLTIIQRENYHFSNDPLIVSASMYLNKLEPLLDDFAQLIGINMKSLSPKWANIEEARLKIKKALRNRNGVFIQGMGAVFAGEDAEAAAMVAKKNCSAKAVSLLYGSKKAIGLFDAILMNIVYKKKYSKLAKKN